MPRPAAAVFALAIAACAAPPSRDAPPDQCGAREMQRLVGLPRSAIPATPPGAVWRVTCTTCPVTMDYNPARLNIFYDNQTGVVREVRCG